MNPQQKQLLLAVLFFATISLRAQPPAPAPTAPKATPPARFYPHELDGFLIRQSKKTVEATLGKPFKVVVNADGDNAYAYHLPGKTTDYLVAYYARTDKSQNFKTVRMELTGADPTPQPVFMGLNIGDSDSVVKKHLGDPSTIEREKGEELDLWNFNGANYSLEFTPDHRLYSIALWEENEKLPALPTAKDAREFAQAIHDGNLETVLDMASGELECEWQRYFGLQDGPARSILGNPKSSVSVCLERAAKTILAFPPEMPGVNTDLRLWTEIHQSGMVTKFPKTSPLAEIVYVVEAGNWRVFEVTFR